MYSSCNQSTPYPKIFKDLSKIILKSSGRARRLDDSNSIKLQSSSINLTVSDLYLLLASLTIFLTRFEQP